jgi:hypothetical protein
MAASSLGSTYVIRPRSYLIIGHLVAAAENLSHPLEDGGRTEEHPTEWHKFPAARSLATALWSALGTEPAATGVDDWLHRAINNAAGRLALFWAHAIASDWRAAGESWKGLPLETQGPLEIMLTGDDDRSAMAQIVFASQVFFFFRADRPWCETHVLPLLDWADPVRARRAWEGYLTWGRWNDQLLSAGHIEDYVAAMRHLGELRDEPRRQFSAHLAGVALSSEIDPLEWMRTFTVTAGVADRIEWMNHVAWMLQELPPEAIEHQWQRWMRQYWQDRINSIPVQLTTEEASAMAAWVVHLTESIEDGVTLALAHAPGFDEHTDILHRLDDLRIRRIGGSSLSERARPNSA